MRVRIKTLYLLVLYLALTGQCCSLIGRPLQISALGSLGTMLVAGASMLAFALILLDPRHDRKENRSIAWLLLTVVAVFGSFATSMQYQYSYLVSILMFLQIPVFLIVATKIEKKSVTDLIYLASLMQAIMFIAISFTGYSHRYFTAYGETTHANLTLGYGNPNEAGIYLLINGIMLLSGAFHYRDKRRLFFSVAYISVSYLAYLTECRVVIVLLVLVLTCTISFRKFTLKPMVRMLVLLFPFVFIIMSFVLPDITILGEVLDTGRSSIYRRVFSDLNFAEILFGNFTEFKLQNLHNAYVSIFASLGLFVLIPFVVNLNRSLKMVDMVRLIGKDQLALMFGFLAVILHGSVEAALLTSGTVYSVSVFLLYYMLLKKTKE